MHEKLGQCHANVLNHQYHYCTLLTFMMQTYEEKRITKDSTGKEEVHARTLTIVQLHDHGKLCCFSLISGHHQSDGQI